MNTENIIELKQQRAFSTRGYKKLWNFFLEVVKCDYFQAKIGELRNYYGVPQNGFKAGKIYPTSNGLTRLFGGATDDKPNRVAIKNIYREIKKMCKKYSLHYMDWHEIIYEYFLTNKIFQIPYTNSYNLCLISDLVEEKREPFGKDFIDSDDMAFPIAIRISPYASQRDIIDYVKKMFGTIEEFQSFHKVKGIKIGKIKSRKTEITERNAMIFKERNRPVKKIRSMLADKGIFLDDGHIGKIISLELKRRKEV